MFLGRALMLTKGLVLASSCTGYETIVEPYIGKGGAIWAEQRYPISYLENWGFCN